MSFDYSTLADNLHNGSLIAFVGSGASRTYHDPATGYKWIGLNGTGDIVNILSRKRSYVQVGMTFPAACFLYREREGRGELERFLQEQFDRPAVRPSPAHVMLANTSFACYVTTNFDRLLESALQEARKQPHSIIEDDDVASFRISDTPVIKLHGCVTRPKSLVAAEDEYVPIANKLPLIDAMLRVNLANKSVLFLGFSLQDQDFRSSFDDTKRMLGDRMPRSYAIVKEATQYEQDYWRQKGLTIVVEDLTEFLRGLQSASIERKMPAVYHPRDNWMNNVFFQSLHKIRTSPSETQAISAFVDHLLAEVRSPSFALKDIIENATRAVAIVMEQKPHFEAFRREANAALKKIREECPTKDDAESYIRILLTDREQQAARLSSKWDGVVKRNANLLTYSQSVRVADLLRGAPKGVQDTCQLYVAECRPKSPLPFQDAFAVCEALVGSGYHITLVPDACIGHLIERKQIDAILLGAHAVFFRENKPISYVNTCGSSLISAAATAHKIPVYVIAESSKFIELTGTTDPPNISFAEEEHVFAPVEPLISNLKASGQAVEGLNVGYDYCLVTDDVHIISERP